jgi:hypothetical protein
MALRKLGGPLVFLAPFFGRPPLRLSFRPEGRRFEPSRSGEISLQSSATPQCPPPPIAQANPPAYAGPRGPACACLRQAGQANRADSHASHFPESHETPANWSNRLPFCVSGSHNCGRIPTVRSLVPPIPTRSLVPKPGSGVPKRQRQIRPSARQEAHAQGRHLPARPQL